jgi:electron transport complex protein RnfC
MAKGRIQELADAKARAERARQRFEARNERQEREQLEREEDLARQKAEAQAAGPAAIAEILRRKQRNDEDDPS